MFRKLLAFLAAMSVTFAFAAVDVKHVSPEGQRQSFDKLRTVGFW